MEKQLEFTIDIYPPPLRQIIEDTHRDLNFPVNYIAASLLLAVSVALGNSRVVNGNQKCSDFGNSECSIFGIKTTVLLASAVQ